ncbi:MAG: rod shape-determining protein MreD [Hyphomicrobiales bacterium]|nr:rod shape-determining protein MreD [Hyphomicrobiales bacterium]
MNPAPWVKLDTLGRQLMPAVVTFSFLILSAVPLRLPPLDMAMPSLALIAIYFWTLYRPELMPAIVAFAFGLIEDIVTGAPLGVGAMVYVTVHAMVNSQRAFFAGKPFAVIWLGFALTIALAFTLGWLLVCLFYVSFVHGAGILLQGLITVSCLPFLWWVLARFHISVLRQV